MPETIKNKKIILAVLIFLAIITLATAFYGSTDISDYIDPAKFFSGSYAANIRSSHSFLFSWIISPFFALTKNFLAFKIINLIFIILIVYSVYFISRKDIRAFWLMLLSPIVWYLAPWVNPIIVSAFFLLWAWYHIDKYDKELSKLSLLYAGIFVGIALAFWDTILFFGAFLALPFLFNKKLSHSLLFIIAVLAGLLPRLILDYFLFNFPFFTMIKNLFGIIAIALFLENSPMPLAWRVVPILLIFLIIPLYFWKCAKPIVIKKEMKTLIFLLLSLLLILSNPQPRYLMALIPIMIVISSNYINRIQWRKQMLLSIIVSVIVIAPYIIQVGYHLGNDIHGIDVVAVVAGIKNLSVSTIHPSDLISQDLEEIEKEFPEESFIVGNTDDSYNSLARFYWGTGIKEFISIQDYNLWLDNETDLFKKRFAFLSNIEDRRYIWIEAGISKNPVDTTNYESLKYALSMDEKLDLNRFKLIKKYDLLYLWEKE